MEIILLISITLNLVFGFAYLKEVDAHIDTMQDHTDFLKKVKDAEAKTYRVAYELGYKTALKEKGGVADENSSV